MYWNESTTNDYELFTRLTLTWDVLKWGHLSIDTACDLININMRCIEIHIDLSLKKRGFWLTLTWDVLK